MGYRSFFIISRNLPEFPIRRECLELILSVCRQRPDNGSEGSGRAAQGHRVRVGYAWFRFATRHNGQGGEKGQHRAHDSSSFAHGANHGEAWTSAFGVNHGDEC